MDDTNHSNTTKKLQLLAQKPTNTCSMQQTVHTTNQQLLNSWQTSMQQLNHSRGWNTPHTCEWINSDDMIIPIISLYHLYMVCRSFQEVLHSSLHKNLHTSADFVVIVYLILLFGQQDEYSDKTSMNQECDLCQWYDNTKYSCTTFQWHVMYASSLNNKLLWVCHSVRWIIYLYNTLLTVAIWSHSTISNTKNNIWNKVSFVPLLALCCSEWVSNLREFSEFWVTSIPCAVLKVQHSYNNRTVSRQ